MALSPITFSHSSFEIWCMPLYIYIYGCILCKNGTGVILSNTQNIAVIEHPWHLLYISHVDRFRQELKHVAYTV